MSAKKKLEHFAEFSSFPHTVEVETQEVLHADHPLKGKWAQEHFNNNKPIVLELGCGKGEYTLAQARLRPERNYIGVDIKGARMWRGAKTSVEEGLENVGFLRMRIELIRAMFAAGEVSEIWFTFPDPQVKRALKRLTSSRFLGYYQQFLVDGGLINLKTDSDLLFEYTRAVVAENQLELLVDNADIYGSELKDDPLLSVRTHYEQMWLQQGYKSKYISFRLDVHKALREPDFEFDGEKR